MFKITTIGSNGRIQRVDYRHTEEAAIARRSRIRAGFQPGSSQQVVIEKVESRHS